jgi:hypothetical protein
MQGLQIVSQYVNIYREVGKRDKGASAFVIWEPFSTLSDRSKWTVGPRAFLKGHVRHRSKEVFDNSMKGNACYFFR